MHSKIETFFILSQTFKNILLLQNVEISQNLNLKMIQSNAFASSGIKNILVPPQVAQIEY